MTLYGRLKDEYKTELHKDTEFEITQSLAIKALNEKKYITELTLMECDHILTIVKNKSISYTSEIYELFNH
tara:strand:+ start:319 stop:531 length:213 start_codon:yes stop_codon:yes gene_type:complete